MINTWRGLRNAEKREIILGIIKEHPEGLIISEIVLLSKASFSPVSKILMELYFRKQVRIKTTAMDYVKRYYPKTSKKGTKFFGDKENE